MTEKSSLLHTCEIGGVRQVWYDFSGSMDHMALLTAVKFRIYTYPCPLPLSTLLLGLVNQADTDW